MSKTTIANGQGQCALQYRDGQTIHLRQGWKMEFLTNHDAEVPYLQAFVNSPCGTDSASLNWARHEGTTSGGEEIEIPDAVMALIQEERFDDFA